MDDHAAPSNQPFAVFVIYQLIEGAMQAFLLLATTHAARTLSEDRDCLQYDVVASTGDRVFFYEAYATAEAHSRHLQSAHLDAFRKARANLVVSCNEYHGAIVATAECPSHA